jgi:hypothetical protein
MVVWTCRIIGYLTALSMLAVYLLIMSSITRSLPTWATLTSLTIWQCVSMIQLLTSGLFIYCAYQFSPRNYPFPHNRKTHKTLKRLSLIAISGFLSFIIAAINNIIIVTFSFSHHITMLAIGFQLQEISRSIRFIALLLFLGIKIPISHTQATSKSLRKRHNVFKNTN